MLKIDYMSGVSTFSRSQVPLDSEYICDVKYGTSSNTPTIGIYPKGTLMVFT